MHEPDLLHVRRDSSEGGREGGRERERSLLTISRWPLAGDTESGRSWPSIWRDGGREGVREVGRVEREAREREREREREVY